MNVILWEAMRSLTDREPVFNALQNFASDPSEDNSVFVVEAILEAVGFELQPPGGA